MIFGVGIDLVEIERIKQTIETHHKFANRLLTEREMLSFNRIRTKHRQAEFLAGRWAAKEAFSKALGTGIGSQLHFHDIEIMQAESGQPYIETTKFKGRIYISITHTATFAAAQVVLENADD